jgi:undecaprenyl pyrophosphate phosphatase UppP
VVTLFAMTTFQALIDAFLHALAQILPISDAVPNALLQTVLHWPSGGQEILCLILCMATFAFLIFFRFDWLGMISAFFRSIFQPMSLKTEARSLDQHTLMFLLLVFLPAYLLRHFTAPLISENEIITHPFVNAILTASFAFGLYFAHRWNKRINGLNHLKLFDGFFIGAITLLSAHPALPYIGLLWFGLAVRNYHYEAVFKYSMLALGSTLMAGTVHVLSHVGLKSSFDTLGHLNSVAILVVSFVTFWMSLENLQKSLNESTFRTFQWLNGVFALFFVAVYFLRDAG